MEYSRENLALLITALTFAVLFFLTFAAYQAIRKRKKRRVMIQKISDLKTRTLGFDAFESHRRADESVAKSFFSTIFTSLGTKFSEKEPPDYSNVRLKFLRAGLRVENIAAAFWGAKIYFALFLILICVGCKLFLLKALNARIFMFLCVSSGVTGFYIPDIWLSLKSSIRKSKVVEGLPDTLDLLALCVEAGMGWDSAVNKISRELRDVSPVLSEELSLMNLEMRAGKARSQALRNFALRTNAREVGGLVKLLIQSDQFGSSIVETVRVYSEAYRMQRFQKAEEIAAKLPVKLMVPLAFFIFPSLMAVLLGPAFIRIFRVVFERI